MAQSANNPPAPLDSAPPAAPACVETRALAMTSVEGGAGARLHMLTLERPAWPEWSPGQFVMLRPAENWGHLVWARPFSICDVDDAGLRIFFQEAGRGTARLGRLNPGDPLVLWGPLGRGFAAPADGPALLLAGGMGIAPFAGYVRRYADCGKLSLEFGHRLPLEGYPFAELAARIPAAAHLERGPADLEAFINRLKTRIAETSGGLVLACGPMPFLRTVQRFCRESGVAAQLSLESRMACGVGACLGCVVKSAEGMRDVPAEGWPVQVCKCGPVFWSHEIDLG